MKNIKKYDNFLNEGLKLIQEENRIHSDQWLFDKITKMIKDNFDITKLIKNHDNGKDSSYTYKLDDDEITIIISWTDDDHIFDTTVLINNTDFDFNYRAEEQFTNWIVDKYDEYSKLNKDKYQHKSKLDIYNKYKNDN